MREIVALISRQTGQKREDIVYQVLENDQELQTNMGLVDEILDLK